MKQYMKNYENPLGTKIISNLTALYFFEIAAAIPKNHALHLIYYLCFLKEINF
jgi:hypothetical protein